MRRPRDVVSLPRIIARFAGIAHLCLLSARWHESRWLGGGLLIVAAVLLSVGLDGVVTRRFPSSALLAAGTSAATGVYAYAWSRLVGLPGQSRLGWDLPGVLTMTAEAALVATLAINLRPRFSRRTGALALATLLIAPVAAQANLPQGGPQHCIVPTRSLTLYAEELPAAGGRPRLGYGLSPTTASVPGPLIELVEGDCLEVTLVNHVSADTLRAVRDDGHWPSDPGLPLGVSLHPHGVRYTPTSDGTVHTGSFVPPGQARTYLWYAAPRVAVNGRVTSPGSAGYWWYHDHVVGTDHGTGGLATGLFGGLIVRRAGDVVPDRTYVVGMGGPSALINFRGWPDTFACDTNGNRPGSDCFVANQGERVEFLVVGVPGPLAQEDMHVFHLHGHTWADNRTGLLDTLDDATRVIDAKSIAPSESFGFQVMAGDDSGPGDWMLHCHIQEHSDRGMMTFFRVLPSNPFATPAAPTSTPALSAHHHRAAP